MTRSPRFIVTLWLLLCSLLPALAKTHPDPDRHSLTRVQVGLASWYGAQWKGRETASGETFEPERLTAASPTLPLGSIIEVTNLRNGKTVQLRINDRGPWHGHRILDVSRAAARVLGFVERGVTRVRIRLLRTPAHSSHSLAAAAQP
jgi:rare lipoprotein A